MQLKVMPIVVDDPGLVVAPGTVVNLGKYPSRTNLGQSVAENTGRISTVLEADKKVTRGKLPIVVSCGQRTQVN